MRAAGNLGACGRRAGLRLNCAPRLLPLLPNMTSTPRQDSLFALDESVALPVAVAGSSRQLSPVQKEFNRLTGRLESRRQALESLLAEADRLRQRWADESAPRLSAVDRAMRTLIQKLDALLQQPPKGLSLKRRERAALVDYLLDLVENRLEHTDSADNAALEAVFDRHSKVSLAELREEDDEFFRSGLEGLADELGVEFVLDDDEATLQARIAEAARAQAQARAEQDAQRAERRRKGRPSTAQKAAQRREEALRDAGQSLREVFRRLASALHPDRESDPEEKARKTALMQQANQAYEANDLMTLLRLQVEADQLDPDRLAVLPEARLRGYNLLLKEQIATVDGQIGQLQVGLQEEFGNPFAYSRRFTVDAMNRAIDERLAELRRIEQTHRRDLDMLGDASTLRALIRDLQREQKQRRREEDDEMDALFNLLAAELQAESAPGGGKRRKPGKQGRT